MTSFGYRLNSRYAIKECSSYGALYTRDCCSKGNVEDKILVPKPPKNCARCGHPVDGPYCQGCALLRIILEEDLVTHFQDFQNTFESSVYQRCQCSSRAIRCQTGPQKFRDGEACQRCTCTRCGSGLSKGLCLIYRNNQNSLNDSPSISANSSQNPPQIDEHCYECGDALDVIFCQQCTSDEVIKSSVEDLIPILSESEGIPDNMCDVHLVNNPTPLEAKDHFNIVINSNDDYSSSDDDSLYYENIEYVEASPYDSELVSLEVEKNVIPEDEEIEDDNLREKLLKVNLLIAKIEALKDNPTSSFEFLTKSSSTSPKPFLEETDTFDNSLPEFENFCFDLEEISCGSTTTHSDISLSEYDSFIYDLSNDQFPPTDRSDFTHEELVNEPAHIISPPKYDCFYFRNLSDPVEDDHSPLLAYVVWIFLAYLTYPVIRPHLHSFGNEDTIFDPGITINRFYSFKPGLSHRSGTFKKFNTHRCHLNESPMEMLFSTLFPMDQ
nr:hypothetical protein [Tanacetum cinerariifolium]